MEKQDRNINELREWLKANSSGVYRPAAHAATVIEEQESELITLRADNSELRAKLAAVESQRPHWAKGYSTDSIAAQVSGGALSELWELLGVSNQTDAVEKLQRLVAAEKQEPIYQKRHLDERWWEDTDKNNFAVCTSLRHIETRKVFLCPVPADKPAAPSHSQQSARTCDDAVLHALEKAQPFVEMARESGIAGAREAEILMANVYDTVRDRCPSHESEQGDIND